MEDTNQPRPECPRCGYDLSGQVDSWVDACPLAGVCSECGLRLEFGAILNETLARKWRFFEVAERRLVRAFLTTANRAVRPWVFWRWVRMEHPVSWVRMWLGAAGAGVWLFAAMGVVWAALLWAAWFPRLYVGIDRYRYWSESSRQIVHSVRFALTPIDGGHYHRWFGPLAANGLVAAVVIVLMPLCFLLLPDTLKRARVRKRHLIRIAAWSLIGAPLLVQATKCGFEFAGGLSAYIHREWEWQLGRYAEENQGRVALALVIAWVLVWWFLACREYLKLPRAFGVALAMVVMSLLAAVLVVIMIPGASVSLLT